MRVIHLEIAGQVQGIGFRHFLRERAKELHIAGWVRNLSSGNVELAATGADEALDALMTAINSGPPGAQVKQIIRLNTQRATDLPMPFTILK